MVVMELWRARLSSPAGMGVGPTRLAMPLAGVLVVVVGVLTLMVDGLSRILSSKGREEWVEGLLGAGVVEGGLVTMAWGVGRPGCW